MYQYLGYHMLPKNLIFDLQLRKLGWLSLSLACDPTQ